MGAEPIEAWVEEFQSFPKEKREEIDWFMARMIGFRYQRQLKFTQSQYAYDRYFGRPW